MRINNFITFTIIVLLLSCNHNKKEYYANRVIKKEYTLKRGKLNGKLVEYNFKGDTVKIEYYSNGLLDGINKEFNEFGNLSSEISYKDGKREGLYLIYFDDGSLEMHAEYHLDKPVYYVHYAKNGDVLDEKRKIKIEFADDTIFYGDTSEAKIKVYGPVNNKKSIEVRVRNSQDDFISSWDKIEIDEKGIGYCSIIPYSSGNYKIELKYEADTNVFYGSGRLTVLPTTREGLQPSWQQE